MPITVNLDDITAYVRELLVMTRAQLAQEAKHDDSYRKNKTTRNMLTMRAIEIKFDPRATHSMTRDYPTPPLKFGKNMP